MQLNTIDGIETMPPLELDYRLDPTIDVINEPISFEQGLSFKYHTALYNTNDTSFNKYTNFYLTDQYKISDVLELKPLPDVYPETITTYLSFNRLSTDPLSGLGALTGDTCLTATSAVTSLTAEDTTSEYLTILLDKSGVSTGTDSHTITKQLSAERFIGAKLRDTLEQKFYFSITFLNGIDCVVYHVSRDDRYFLSHRSDTTAKLQFEKGDLETGLEHDVSEILSLFSDERHIFKYTYYREHNILRLYKEFFGNMCVVELMSDEDRADPGNAGNPPLQLTTILDEWSSTDPGTDFDIDTNYPNVLEMTDRTSMRVRPPMFKLDAANIDSKVINYKKNNNYSSLSIDSHNTSKELHNNHLLHSEYYYLTGNSLPVNMITLKNQLTPVERVSTQNVWENEAPHQQRDYNKLFTGTNQLQGTDNIYMDYTSKSFDLELQPGMNYFNTPQNMEPVIRMNINDSKLYESGAIGSDNPSRSDKIYKKRAGYSDTTRWGNPSDSHTGTWLCTWLSGGDINSKPIWVDRYYNPAKTSYIAALMSNTYPHNTFTNKQDDAIFARGDGVYDKQSDLTLEPGCFYAYYHVTSTDMVRNLKKFDPVMVQKDLTTYATTSELPLSIAPGTREYTFTGKQYGKVHNTKRLDSGMGSEISISFDVNFTDWKKPFGHQIIGNYTNNGIGIFNTNDVSPFIFVLGSDGTNVGQVTQNTSIRIYDREFKLYNYITNNSYLRDTDTPGYFIDLIVREFPDNIYAIVSNGDILEINHDGIIIARYIQWSSVYGDSFENTISDITYDDKCIYILTHTGSERTDYVVNEFNTVNKTFKTKSDICTTPIPVPVDLIHNTNQNYGRSLGSGPPSLITIKDDPPPYQHNRSIYLGYGDKIKAGVDQIWIHTTGEKDKLSGFQKKHDVIYGFEVKTLQLLPGKIYDNAIEDSNLKLSIQDYTTDTQGNLWVAHSGNVLAKLNQSRKILSTSVLEEKEIMSLTISKTFVNDSVVESLYVLSRSIGGEELSVQIGPNAHPTALLNGRAYRKASGWYENGGFNSRPTDTSSIINYDTVDSTIAFDDTKHIIYPFVEGSSRFGTHVQDIDNIVSTDTTGIVLNGDYSTITEDFDYIVTEVDDVIYADQYNIDTVKPVNTVQLPNLSITDINNFPSMITSHQYTKENFPGYFVNGLNLKILLEPQFAKTSPDLVNMKLDLETLNTNLPYTGYHNICININNTTGKIEMYIDGHIDAEHHIYTYEPGKYTFSNIFTRELLVGASPYLNETTVQTKLRDPASYTTRGMKLKNLNIINKCMTREDIVCMLQSYRNPDSVKWSIPNGLRNHIEGIDRVFNHSIPPRKSNMFNVNIRNSEIKSKTLQTYITNKLLNTLSDLTPAGSKISQINWYNEILD